MKQSFLTLLLFVGITALVSCASRTHVIEVVEEIEEKEELTYSYLQEAYEKSLTQQPQDLVTDKEEYPYAAAIPGKKGYVLSPYSQKPLDVRDQQSGDLILDPYYARSENKYFRIP